MMELIGRAQKRAFMVGHIEGPSENRVLVKQSSSISAMDSLDENGRAVRKRIYTLDIGLAADVFVP